MPLELEAMYRLSTFGAQALYGRTLGVVEVRRMELMARVVNVYRSFHASRDWAAWREQHPADFELLTYAMKVADG